MDSLIRFSELRVSIVTGSVSVGGRKRGTISAPLSFFLSVLSLVSFFRLMPSPWSQRTKLNYKLQIPPWNLTLALLQLSLKEHEGTKRLCRLTGSLSCGLGGQMAWPETLSGVVVSQAAEQTRSFFLLRFDPEHLCRRMFHGVNLAFSRSASIHDRGEELKFSFCNHWTKDFIS